MTTFYILHDDDDDEHEMVVDDELELVVDSDPLVPETSQHVTDHWSWSLEFIGSALRPQPLTSLTYIIITYLPTRLTLRFAPLAYLEDKVNEIMSLIIIDVQRFCFLKKFLSELGNTNRN